MAPPEWEFRPGAAPTMTTPEATTLSTVRRARRGTLCVCGGVLCTFLDVRAGGVDLLPDVVGYGLIALGASALVPLEAAFRRARLLAWVLAAVSLANLVEVRWFLAEHGDLTYTYNPLWPALVLGAVLDIVAFWFLIGGVRRLAVGRCRMVMARSAEQYRSIYVIASGFRAALTMFYLHYPQLEFYFGVPVTAFDYLARILILGLLYAAWRQFDDLAPYEVTK